MPKVGFTANIQRHVRCPEMVVAGHTVREALDNVFAANPLARGYVLDDQAALRKHIVVFVNGTTITDRTRLTDPVDEAAVITIFQALSGG